MGADGADTPPGCGRSSGGAAAGQGSPVAGVESGRSMEADSGCSTAGGAGTGANGSPPACNDVCCSWEGAGDVAGLAWGSWASCR